MLHLLHIVYTLILHFPTLFPPTLLYITLATLCLHSYPTLLSYTFLHFFPTSLYITLATLCLYSHPILWYTFVPTLFLHFFGTLFYITLGTLWYTFPLATLCLHFSYTFLIHFPTLFPYTSLHYTCYTLSTLLFYTLTLHFWYTLTTLFLPTPCYTLSTLISYTWLSPICYTLFTLSSYTYLPWSCYISSPIWLSGLASSIPTLHCLFVTLISFTLAMSLWKTIWSSIQYGVVD